MKKRVLSLLICGTVVISGGIFNPVSAYAAESCEYSIESMLENIIERCSILDNIINKDSSKAMVVDSGFKGKDGQKVRGVRVYKTIQAALDKVPENNKHEINIIIKNGTYKEKLTIDKPNITLIGEDSEKTIITYDAASGSTIIPEHGGDGTAQYGTEGCGSIIVTEAGEGFAAANLTIENSFDEAANADMKNRQAVALKNEANKSIFVNCRFLGNQDTLFAKSNKQYYYNCYIEGDVDFIFGGASAVFEKCEIKSLDREGKNPKGYIAAPSTLEENKYGFLILDSKLTSNITEAGTVHLGRPWHPSYETKSVVSSVVYKNCEMGAHISEKGWDKMSGHLPEDNDLFEYGSTGEGARISDTRRVLTDEQASMYTKENVLNGWKVKDMDKKVKSLMKLSGGHHR